MPFESTYAHNLWRNIIRNELLELTMNNLLLLWAPGGWELIIILVIVLILFGANRLPQLA